MREATSLGVVSCWHERTRHARIKRTDDFIQEFLLFSLSDIRAECHVFCLPHAPVAHVRRDDPGLDLRRAPRPGVRSCCHLAALTQLRGRPALAMGIPPEAARAGRCGAMPTKRRG